MAITAEFRAKDIRKHLVATGLKGRNVTFLDEIDKEQMSNLFQAAEMLEPFMRTGTNLLEGKALYTLFFQPSTRTRCSHEDAMIRLGGQVITESDPTHNSSVAKNESLYDSMRTISTYADVIVLRHPDDQEALGAVEALTGVGSPVISGGYGHVTHPTQGLLDGYTCWRAFNHQLEDKKIVISTPDLSRARSGQSFALALASMGAHIIYSGSSELRTPEVVRQKLVAMGASFEEHFDLDQKAHEQLFIEESVDLVYLPGCSVKKDDPNRADFMKKMDNHYLGLDMLQRVKEATGKIVGVHHSLPRNPGEFDFAIDTSPHEIYFKALEFSVALRMALLASVVGVN